MINISFPFSGGGGGSNQQIERQDRRIDQLDRRVDRIERRLGLRQADDAAE